MYYITATLHNQTAYYCAFDLMEKPNTLKITKDIDSAYKLKTIEKAEEWKQWLEKKFPDYIYEIKPLQ